ncbi:hypothetical protein [Nocardioides sp. NPDC047086]|uniref:hypothetical protein n=1 Tax=Nocardioides sp. NPDC047086 TaxID=3154810 RepID=UPI0033D04F41
MLLQICSVHTPCRPYLRVLEEGQLQVGDEIVVVHRPDHDITVSTLFRALKAAGGGGEVRCHQLTLQ